MLAEWRRVRGTSQLDLATRADVSPRHVSFVETGRSKPSREMVLQLATALDVPLRERNALLLAAGFAPLYRETKLDAPELAAARRALEFILDHQEPYPAVVLDRHWNILSMNGAGQRFVAFMTAGQPAIPGEPNVVRSVFHPHGLRPWITNWEEVASHLVQRIHREAVGGVTDDRTKSLLREVLAYPGVPETFRSPDVEAAISPLVALHFQKGDVAARFFSTVTTLGTPQDVTLQELRVECFFPADRATEDVARAIFVSAESRVD